MDTLTATTAEITKLPRHDRASSMCDGREFREGAQVFVPCPVQPSLRMALNNSTNDVLYSCFIHAGELLNVSLVSS